MKQDDVSIVLEKKTGVTLTTPLSFILPGVSWRSANVTAIYREREGGREGGREREGEREGERGREGEGKREGEREGERETEK